MRFAAIYGTGAAIGCTPEQVDRMSMWQFIAAVEGWIKANTSEDEKSEGGMMAQKDADEIWEWMQTMPQVPLTKVVH